MYFFGWGHRTIPLGSAGSHECHVCQARGLVQVVVEYRYFHLLWVFGPILSRRYHLTCPRCGTEYEVRSARLSRVVRAGNARFISFGPFFLIILGGALVLLGPGDFSD